MLSQGFQYFKTVVYLIVNKYFSIFLLLFFQLALSQHRLEELKSYIQKGDLAAAEKIIDTYDSNVTEPDVLLTLGDFYLKKGRNSVALEKYELAIKGFESIQLKNTKNFATCLNSLAIALWNEGNNAKALEYAFESLHLREKLLGKSTNEYAASLNDIGLIYSNIDPMKSLEYYREAKKVYAGIYGEDHAKIGQAHTNIGIIYKKLKEYTNAINEFGLALKIWNSFRYRDTPSKAFTHRFLGETYQEMGVTNLAKQEAEKALTIYKGIYGNKHPDVASTLTFLGTIAVKENKLNTAIDLFHKALQANYDVDINHDLLSVPTGEHYYNGFVLLNTLFQKANALEKRYLNKSLKIKDLKSAIHHLYLCDKVIVALRKSLVKESDKITLAELSVKIYESGVRIAYLAYQDSFSRKKSFKTIAYSFVEKSKSAILQEAIIESKAKAFSGIPSEVLKNEVLLKADITFLEQQLLETNDNDAKDSLKSQLFELNKKHEIFIKQLEQNYPKYFELKYKSSQLTIEEIQASLDENEAIINYFVDGDQEVIYIFSITQKGIKVKEKLALKALEKYSIGLRNGILYQSKNVYTTSAHKLYDILIPNLSKKITKLIIIPAGELGTLPFESLLTQHIKDSNYDKLPYLLNEYNISYAYATSLALQNKVTESPSKKALLCAPVEFATLSDLPASKIELDSISGLLQNKLIEPTTFVDKSALESAIKQTDLTKYQYIHFATHGVVNPEKPALSRIILHKDQQDDGSLYTPEIYNLKINADLVTLSACETGLGKVQQGEGIIGLSRSFIYAGAKNMIVSLWSVSDASTSNLMIHLYDNILSSTETNFASSLQEAKKALINDKDFAAPYYWAPFILIGK